MRVRFSSCIGLPVVCDSINEVLGHIVGILIQPDKATVEGFFIHTTLHLQGTPFLAFPDIVRWGTVVHVREADAVFPVEERVRLQPLLQDTRTLLHQKIRTESGRKIGVCQDVQFNTDSMRCEWIFPRRFWRWGVPLPLTEVLEVRSDAIIVHDQQKPAKEFSAEGSVDLLPRIPAVPGVSDV